MDKWRPWRYGGCPSNPLHGFLIPWGLTATSLFRLQSPLYFESILVPSLQIFPRVETHLRSSDGFPLYDTAAISFGLLTHCTWTQGKRSGAWLARTSVTSSFPICMERNSSKIMLLSRVTWGTENCRWGHKSRTAPLIYSLKSTNSKDQPILRRKYMTQVHRLEFKV
jgi:hypothetical protein